MCNLQKSVSTGGTGQGGMRNIVCDGGLTQDTDSVLNTLCPLAPPSMVRWLGDMTLQGTALSASVT